MNSLADEFTGHGIPQPKTGHQSDPRQPDVEEARRLLDTAERHGVALLPELLAVDMCVLGTALQSAFDEPVWRSWLAAEWIGLGTGHRERLSPAEDHARSGNLNQIYQYARRHRDKPSTCSPAGSTQRASRFRAPSSRPLPPRRRPAAGPGAGDGEPSRSPATR